MNSSIRAQVLCPGIVHYSFRYQSNCFACTTSSKPTKCRRFRCVLLANYLLYSLLFQLVWPLLSVKPPVPS